MAAQRKKSSKRQTSGNPYRGRITLLFFLSIMLGFIFLWGKVQIDFRLRRNEELKIQRDRLKSEVVHLRLQISTKKRYQRIVHLAQEQGLVFISTGRLKNLEVEMPGNREPVIARPESYASIAPVKLF